MVNSLEIVKIKIIESGDSGILLNESYTPNEMEINDEIVEFNNTIVPSGQNITLKINISSGCCEGMFFINKTLLNNHLNSIIEEVDLSLFNPGKISTTKNMFLNQTNLKKVNIKISINYVNNMERMFQNCTSLESIDLSSFTINSYGYMNYMFSNCNNLKSILLPKTNQVFKYFYMNNMFSFCEKLESIDLSNYNLYGYIDFNCTFCYDYSLKSVKLPFLKVDRIDMNSMLESCSNLDNIFFTTYNDKFIYTNSAENAFNNCTSLTTLYIYYMNFSYVNNLRYMFNNCTSLKSLYLYPSHSFKYTKFINTEYMFNNCSELQYIDLSFLQNRNINNMNHMFNNCKSLTSLFIPNININDVEDLSYMFNNCTNLSIIRLSVYKLPNLTNVKYMFNNCHSLSYFFFHFDDSYNIQDYSYMFNNCTLLTSLTLYNFKGSSINNTMEYMFNNCTNLTSLDLSSLNINNTISTKYMFNNCRNLKTLALSNLDIFSTKNTSYVQ